MVDRAAVLARVMQPRVLFAANTLLALILLWLLAGLIWTIAALFREPTLPLAAATNPPPSATAGAADYQLQTLLAVPLFGAAPPQSAEAGGGIQGDLKTSTLKIAVLGLVAGSDESGVAVLRHGSATRAYRIGEKIEVPGNVKLLAVMPDHIVIENNRRQEKIELDKKALAGGISRSGGGLSSNDRVDLSAPAFRELIGDPRDMVQNSPLKLAQYFAASPVMDNGQLQGYALKPGRDKRLFDLLGLESGDVVLSVNGQSLADLPTQELFKLLEEGNSFELLVQRNDSILSKRLEL